VDSGNELSGSIKDGDFLKSCVTFHFSSNFLLHRVSFKMEPCGAEDGFWETMKKYENCVTLKLCMSFGHDFIMN
jgi:hypothetical protein